MKTSQWRDAGRRLEIAGVPVVLFSLYAAWFQWPETTTFYIVTGIIIFFRILSFFGFTITILWQRLLRLLRGLRLTGRPWWYRKFFE
ncbi:IcmT/TraK family protein [Enterobacter hormaechei]|uniref:IcmT/TraK family protein n=1 Tax=Enterobacteriaceae TaxID=543 RepID=UPI0018696CCF|nr:IcmT/TraK family protein [Escherichia coli]MBE3289178.1 conjugal transfer protein [Enterobacter cloacae complex sp. P31C]MCK7015643.1 IcmT/TraK family protein [Enterobacter roggenkampii]MCK7350609.1 IcmT/TraK family protein [Enterobacter kobei]MCM7533548.1 IcmT/TraK family protein [Enterobacter quasiroggenkampii]MCU2724208.1 IcmT/TraK family protein [Enterobacter hormaechei subsp. xiangfangensis]MDE7787808.1 IcmT/TraK family protein [Enterobacter hormaechei]HAS1070044.1 conjugal transfer 